MNTGVNTGRRNMPGENKQSIAARKKRVQALKRMIILLLILLLAFPITCSIILMVKVRDINTRMDELNGKVVRMAQAVYQLTSDADGVREKASDVISVGKGDAAGANASPVKAGETVDAQMNPGEPHARHKVYLTFDDGPSIYTDTILDTLKKYDVKATFFVVGKEDERSRNAVKRIVDEGHTIGMHSYSHKYSEIYASMESFEADLKKLQDYIYDTAGTQSRFYRFPGGSSNTVSSVSMQDLVRYLDGQGIEFYDWNVASGDGGSVLLSAENLIHNSTVDLEKWNTAIILFHDSADKPTTVEALPTIIENILGMEDTVILPITENTVPVQHIQRRDMEGRE